MKSSYLKNKQDGTKVHPKKSAQYLCAWSDIIYMKHIVLKFIFKSWLPSEQRPTVIKYFRAVIVLQKIDSFASQ